MVRLSNRGWGGGERGEAIGRRPSFWWGLECKQESITIIPRVVCIFNLIEFCNSQIIIR